MTEPDIDRQARRQALMKACAHATIEELNDAIGHFGPVEDYVELRRPEQGLVMIRGRIGGDGAPFNVGEAVVTRAAVRLKTGEQGHAYILGRSNERARSAAVIDALGQDDALRTKLEELFVSRVEDRVEKARARDRRKTAATRVDFFTLVRGEDDA